MKFTSEDLLKAMGLKDGDYITFEDDTRIFEVVQEKDDLYLMCDLRKLNFFIKTINKNFIIIQPKPTLTEDEKVILKNINKEYMWIARNESKECVSVFSDFPTRSRFVWDYCDAMWNLPFNHLFKFIKWEDEPYEIKELLK